jgi:hypothetical protein
MKTWMFAAWIAVLACIVHTASAQVVLPSLRADHVTAERGVALAVART